MGGALQGEDAPGTTLLSLDSDTVALNHIESFNILLVGESGLGKTTFTRDLFSHVDPTKDQEAQRLVEEQHARIEALEDKRRRNKQESCECDDERSLVLIEERETLDSALLKEQEALREQKQQMQRQKEVVASLKAEVHELQGRHKELRRQRDAASERSYERRPRAWPSRSSS